MSHAVGARAPRRGGRAEGLVAAVALCALTLATAAGYCRVFDGWAFLPRMAIVAVVAHAAAAGLRAGRVPLVAAVPVSLLVLAEIIALLHFRDTLAGPFPSRETIEVAHRELALVWQQFPTAVAPVPSTGGYVVGAAIALGLAAIAADAFAFRAFGRAEATVPTGVLMVFTAALGVDRNRVATASLWIAVAMCAVALLRLAHGRSEGAWLGRPHRAMLRAIPAAVVLAAAVAGIAAAAGPRLPGAGQEALVDTRNRTGGVTEVVSPLVDIRSRLVNQSNLEYFSVTSERPAYWRLTGLAVFNGTTWGLPSRPLTDTGGRFSRARPGETEVRQTITVAEMEGQLVPAAFEPIATVGGDAAELKWVADTATLVLAEPLTLEPGLRFEIVSAVGEPTVEELRAASADDPPDAVYLDLPDDFPESVSRTAREVTAGAATPYDRARALQDWFRSEFTYNLDVQRGHGVSSIESFLRLREGYCEQFAGSFAAMARSLGIPARVAVGFTPGDLQPDGRYLVRGRNAHAWPEVWFDDLGWVLFEPTPGRGAPGSEQATGVSAAQEDPFDGTGGGGGGDDDETSPSTVTTVPLPSLPDGGQTPDDIFGGMDDIFDAAPIAPTSSSGGGGSGRWWVLAGIVAAAGVAAWTLGAPRAMRALARRRAARRPEGEVMRCWRRARAATELAGAQVHAGDTPLEHSQRAHLADPAAQAALEELARHATRAVYSPTPPDIRTADTCGALADEVVAAAIGELSPIERLRARFDLRVSARLAGVDTG